MTWYKDENAWKDAKSVFQRRRRRWIVRSPISQQGQLSRPLPNITNSCHHNYTILYSSVTPWRKVIHTIFQNVVTPKITSIFLATYNLPRVWESPQATSVTLCSWSPSTSLGRTSFRFSLSYPSLGPPCPQVNNSPSPTTERRVRLIQRMGVGYLHFWQPSVADKLCHVL